MTRISLTVNGKSVEHDIEPRMLLVEYLRLNVGVTGPHVGCDTTQCGCCVVHLDGRAVKSCTVLALQANGSSVLTIEGLSDQGQPLHPMQQAFVDHHALQCGYCTPGMIMTAIHLAETGGADLDRETVRENLEGNICRCTGYNNIVDAIIDGARRMADQPEVKEGTADVRL
jgi:aerobic carbon-monoxide dehydrogenase small subunit